MLSIRNLDFSYDNQPVFDSLNLKVDYGEFAFIIGRSGSGKSTLFELIYMNLLPDTGEIDICDYNSTIIKKSQVPFLRRKLGVIFQDFKLLEDRTVYQNLEFVLRVTGETNKKIKQKIIRALNEVGLAHKQKNMPNELSGGEKQRIAIARAIINEPTLVLADEPTGNLDPETSDEILEILKKINAQGTAVLLATHNYDLIKKLDKRIIKLVDGKAKKVIIKKVGENS